MQRFLNSIGKGAKTLGVTLVGAVLSAILLAVQQVHLTGIQGLIWNAVGVSVVTAVIATLMRMIGYDPNKDPKVVGPLVPLSPVPPPVAKDGAK